MQESSPPNSSSLINRTEAELVLSIYRELVHRFPELKTKPAVAIISPYKAQVSWCFSPHLSHVTHLFSLDAVHDVLLSLCLQVHLLQQLFRAGLGAELYKMVDINTIDGFQVRRQHTLKDDAAPALLSHRCACMSRRGGKRT